MPIPQKRHWWLRVIREAVALAAPTASISFFPWFKEPGNAYTTFYPTRLTPSAEDRVARADPALGAELFRRVVEPSDPPVRVTIGEYGDGEFRIPGWAAAEGTDHGAVCSAVRDRHDVPGAAAKVVRAIDLEWLAREGGGPDATTSAVVLAWLDKIVELTSRPGVQSAKMDFAKSGVPMALWMMDVFDASSDTSHEIWWSDRNLRLEQ